MTDQNKITIEAEHMDMHNFFTAGGSKASGGEMARLKSGQSGDLSTDFNGDAGVYDFTLRAQDETDGQSTVMIKVNGEVVATIVLDKDSNGRGSNNSGFTNFTVPGLELQPGDTLGIWAKSDGGEMVRLDKIELTKTADIETNTAPTFDNVPADGKIMIDENTTAVLDVNASDADGDNVTYSITKDASNAFEIDAHTGELSFRNAPDFENPTDTGTNNVYDVTIQADDGNGGVVTKTLWVNVNDVDETVPSDAEMIMIEAEDMREVGFSEVSGSNASGGSLIRLDKLGGSGDVFTDFTGNGGTYDITVRAQDESDGQSMIKVGINGVEVGVITLDNDNNGGGSNNGGFSDFTVEGIEINAGDRVSFWVDGDAGEYVRLDKFTFATAEETVDPVDPNMVCLDFEGLTAGTVVDQQFDGVMISAQRATHNTAANDAMIFDSNNPTGGDHDLATNNQNNILIVSEDNDSHDPDDAIGGTIWFKFDHPATIDSIKVIDAEEGGTIRLLDENGQLIKTVNIPNGTDGGIQTVEIDAEGVAQIDLTLNGSGAVDDLKYVPGQAPELGSIGGTYFMDNNDNSIQDAGDMGLAGQTVWLLEVGVGVVATTTTDADGNYLFDDLPAGEYFVRFDGNNVDGKVLVDSNVGNDDTVDSDIDNTGSAGNHNTGVISLGEGEDVRDVDAGVEEPAPEVGSLSGRFFVDVDGNGRDLNNGQDPAVEGVLVMLLDANGNPTGDQVFTDANGEYSFAGLEAGEYGVKFTDPNGVLDGTQLIDPNQDNGGGLDDRDSDAIGDVNESVIEGITVVAGADTPDNDAGVEDLPPELGSLGGTYFMDNNDNSVQDGADMGLEGQTVWLRESGTNILVATTTTDADGNYLFNNLEAGDYYVRFDGNNVGDKVRVDSNVGNDDTIDSDIVNTGSAGNHNTGVISLGEGEDVRNVDAGVEVVDTGDAVIRGRVFMDNNDNSVDDNGDMGVAGVTVTLSNGQTTVTDADGNYEFTGLAAGDYTVTFPTEVDGKVLVDSNVGGDDTVDSDAGANGSTGTITVGIGEVSEDNDAGVEDPGTASIGNKVFLDANGNGQQDAGEQGVDGVQVTLFNAAGVAISTITTTNGGMYLFDELDAGDYSVGFEAPNGFDLTDSNVGNDASDSDADQGTGRTGTINLEIGEADLTVDAGLVEENDAPVAGDDEAIGCAEDDIVVDVLTNDSDPDGDAIAVTSVGGQAINEGETVTVDGVEISLVGGQLVFNGAAQFEDLTIGEEATVSYDYHVSDGNGGVTDASVEVTFKGDANSVQDLFDSLPASGTYQIAADNEANPIGDAAYDMLLNGTGDARFDGVVFNQAYCLSFFDPLNAAETFADAPSFAADVTDGKDGSVFLAGQTSFANGNAAADNLDLVNYILAQDYENDPSGQYTGWEVQLAIWELTDDVNSSDIIALDPAYGDQADVDAIVADAIANGEGFMAGTGDITSFIVDPNPATATNSQPFIVAIDFEDFDCLC